MRRKVQWLVGTICLTLAACSDKMTLDGTVRLDGPIQIQIQSPSVRYTGVFISKELLDRVDVKKTRSDWILAVFGTPTERAKLDDGSEIWKWTYLPLQQDTTLIALVETGKDKLPRPQQSITYLQIRDGVVIDKWRDS